MVPEKLPPEGPSELYMYFRQIAGLWAGKPVPVWGVYTAEAGSLDSWSDEDLQLLIVESRRQLDNQSTEIERVRSRAQFLFTTSLAAIGLSAAVLRELTHVGLVLVWSAGTIMVLLGLLGSAGIILNSKRMGDINVHRFSKEEPSRLRSLAVGYLNSVPAGANTFATQVTMYRDAALFVMLGVLLSTSSWIWEIL